MIDIATAIGIFILSFESYIKRISLNCVFENQSTIDKGNNQTFEMNNQMLPRFRFICRLVISIE